MHLGAAAEVREPLRKYLNRLSDLLFVAARVLNREAGCPDVLWRKDRGRDSHPEPNARRSGQTARAQRPAHGAAGAHGAGRPARVCGALSPDVLASVRGRAAYIEGISSRGRGATGVVHQHLEPCRLVRCRQEPAVHVADQHRAQPLPGSTAASGTGHGNDRRRGRRHDAARRWSHPAGAARGRRRRACGQGLRRGAGSGPEAGAWRWRSIAACRTPNSRRTSTSRSVR